MTVDIIGSIGLLLALGIFILLAFKYHRHFKDLRKAYLNTGMDWPMPDRNSLDANSFRKVLTGPYKLFILIIFNRPNNSQFYASLKGIRFTLVLFVLFPFTLFFILICLLTLI